VETPLQENAEIMSSSEPPQLPEKPIDTSFSELLLWKLNIIEAST
jgi:hypothetical protein